MPETDFREKIQTYLEELLDTKIVIEYIGPIDKSKASDEDLKEFGYGKNLLIELIVNNEKKSYIMSTMNKNEFGHQFFYDRAKSLLLAHSSYNKLPAHAKSIDVGSFTTEDEFKSAGDCKELFLVREKIDGTLYFQDLEKIVEIESVSPLDKERAKSLAEYLAIIHTPKEDTDALYKRRIRELLGHGECIMGLTDSYPNDLDFTTQKELKSIEKKCIDWRYKIKNKKERLCQVHGDFHPWNILFREKAEFSVIDRSRGEWGEAADDMTALSINYLFYSLQTEGKLMNEFFELFDLFWKTYLEKTGDHEILTLAAPFFAWRGLVIASPVWYPDLDSSIRRKIFKFIHEIFTVDNISIEGLKRYFK
ncbi:MAG: aminoglycoside phosphotransferase family protein [Candidatus Lokiarchaeota archaeon]|nr:aminoglycoside phosphotransferase family protein [Candidatus Lokiarchaeota archaeon]